VAGLEAAGLVEDTGSVAARTAKLAIRGTERVKAQRAQRRGEDLNISERAPGNINLNTTQAMRGSCGGHLNGNREWGLAVYHRKVEVATGSKGSHE
jgi:hypothetical protein